MKQILIDEDLYNDLFEYLEDRSDVDGHIGPSLEVKMNPNKAMRLMNRLKEAYNKSVDNKVINKDNLTLIGVQEQMHLTPEEWKDVIWIENMPYKRTHQ